MATKRQQQVFSKQTDQQSTKRQLEKQEEIMKNILTVDPKNGPIKKIQDAINIAAEDSVINIMPGLYKENLLIEKKGLKLQPKAQSGVDIILFVQKGPAITINLNKGEKIFILGIKIMHTGFQYQESVFQKNILNTLQSSNDNIKSPNDNYWQQKQPLVSYESKNFKDQKSENQNIVSSQKIMLNSNQNTQENPFKKTLVNQSNMNMKIQELTQSVQIINNNTPESTVPQNFQVKDNTNSMLILKGGKLYLEDCLLALNFILKAYQSLIVGIILDSNNSELIMNRCEIKGNRDHDTIGIISRKANAIIKDCKIHNHIQGGIHVWAKKYNNFRILNSRIIENQKVGISISGEDSQVLVELCEIKYNEGQGIQIGIANKSQIINNDIKYNINGIEIISGDPYIKNNYIDKNQQHGILSKTYDDIRCDGKILKNISISQNNDSGICCQGLNNFTVIEKNIEIQYNKKCGIKVDQYAHVNINHNFIQKNLGQGILLIETSSAIIEENEIRENIKANIALGGENSQNTLIVSNVIEDGRCEGIFMINGNEAWICRNKIQKNNDGIILVTSVPVLAGNTIQSNKNHGIMILKDSRPQLKDNVIQQNENVGLYIRDKSCGKFANNIIQNNQINLVQEKKHILLQDIVKKNQIIGDIRIPSNYQCQIF